MIEWDKDKIIKHIVDLNNSGINLSDKNIRKDYRQLHAAGVRYFGNWEQALLNSGVDSQRLRKKWSEDEVVKELAKSGKK